MADFRDIKEASDVYIVNQLDKNITVGPYRMCNKERMQWT